MSSLLIIRGPQIGSRFALGERATLGRGEECDVLLADPNASRLHAVIEKNRLAYTLRDCDSANGVFVNGQRVTERLLRRNDLIVIGQTHLLFDAEPDLENALYGGKTVALGVSHGETMRVHSALPDPSGPGESARAEIGMITQLGRLFDAPHASLPELLQQTIARLVEMFGAERGAIFLWDALSERLEPAVAVCPGPEMSADQSLLMQVFRERQALLACDVAPDLSALQESATAPPPPLIGSLMCAPLICDGQAAGVLWVDHAGRDRFSLQDVSLLQAVGKLLAGPVEAARLRERLGLLSRGAGAPAPIIGQSAALLELLEQARRAARHDVTVLIEGETGTGKELIAREIHRQSRRGAGPFVAVNCGAVPAELFESEFFGHEKGAFTGAVSLTPGKIEVAHGGTLFLDEIGELSLAHQPKLLRFLQDHTLYRVGGRKPIRVNVRLIAATHNDLEERARQQLFRHDLFFRLNVVRLRVPPLRERRDDIRRLAEHFMRVCAAAVGKPILGITDDAMIALERHSWPGNIRELQNTIERAVILGPSNVIDRSCLDRKSVV